MRLAETRNEVRVRPRKDRARTRCVASDDASSGDPQRSEGPPSEKIGRGLDALPQMMRLAETRNEVRVRPQKRSGAD